MRRHIAILGGTFDPVHRGHIAVACDVRDAFRLAELRLIPCCRPVHRPPPEASPQQRLEMLRLAVRGHEALVVDDQEIRRGGSSYTIDTVRQIHRDAAGSALVLLVLGMDAFADLARWRRWRELLTLSCLLVLVRPDFAAPQDGIPGRLWLERREQVGQAREGQLVAHKPPQIALSSSELRRALHDGAEPEDFCCAPVAAYIQRYGLYGCRV